MIVRGVERGMTLIEVVVALALLGLLSIGIVSAFRFGELGYEQLVRGDRAARDIVVAQRFVRQAVESAYPFEPTATAGEPQFGLEGLRDRLLVTAPMPLSMHAAGYRRFDMFLLATANGRKDLVVRSNLDRNGATAIPRGEVLVANIAALEWTFLEPIDPAAPAPRHEPRWLDRWTATRRLPALVRLRVSFPPGDSRVWPELTVDPRVTDDANCEFDIVARTCRETRS